MRKNKTVLLVGSIFAVAVNMNGCGVYGPPPEEFVNLQPTVAPVVENLHVIAEPPDWYFSAMGQYAVVRLLSVEESKPVSEGQTGEVLCKIESLSIYNPRLDLGIPSELIIPGEEVSSFSVGDVLFVELGPIEWDGEAYSMCRVTEGEKGAVYSPFTNDGLVLTEALKKSSFYESLTVYNNGIEGYRLSLEKGEDFFMEFGSQPFEEGMTTEETATFFEEFQKAKKDYEVVLKETNG